MLQGHTDFQLTEMAGLASDDHNSLTVSYHMRRGAWSPGSCLFLLLALSVFAWGTAYKLSLYKTNPPGSVTPAKLCKLTSDNAKSQVDHAIEGHKVAFSGLPLKTFPAFTIFVPVLQGEVRPSTSTVSLAPLKAAPILHLRPPPASDHRMFL
jgi:hypothetical protein